MSAPSLEPLKLIFQERERQIYEKNHTPELDDKYENLELVKAAICYAMGEKLVLRGGTHMGHVWPWGFRNHVRSDDRMKNLATAGALIMAEMEREMRLRARIAADPLYLLNRQAEAELDGEAVDEEDE